MSNKTPRFSKDYSTFSSIEKKDIKQIIHKIELGPIPACNDDWKILNQFKKDYPEGIVCAHRINFCDRLVYEFNLTTGEITFTNCRGHKYRGKSYSVEESETRKSFAILRESCKTKGQKLAFNQLLNSFKFKE